MFHVCIINTHGKLYLATEDITGSFILGDMHELMFVKFEGKWINFVRSVTSKLYREYLLYEDDDDYFIQTSTKLCMEQFVVQSYLETNLSRKFLQYYLK